MITAKTSAIAALVLTVTIATFTPAFAEGPRGPGADRGPRSEERGRMPRADAPGRTDFRGMGPRGMGARDMGPGGAGLGFVALVCSENGAERVEAGLGRLSARLALTAEQQAGFDALKAAALTAQTAFADQCAALRPAPSADATTPAARPDPVTRLETRLELDTARIAAMSEVLPELRAFYDSLTDAQKASLFPGRDRPDGEGRGRRGDHRHGEAAPELGPMPGADALGG